MRQNSYKFIFTDYNDKDDHENYIIVDAGGYEAAEILAKAERIKEARNYKKIVRWFIKDYNDSTWKRGNKY